MSPEAEKGAAAIDWLLHLRPVLGTSQIELLYEAQLPTIVNMAL
jgi:hypothetical protein